MSYEVDPSQESLDNSPSTIQDFSQSNPVYLVNNTSYYTLAKQGSLLLDHSQFISLSMA